MSKANEPTKEEVAGILENFLEGKGTDFQWDDFTLGAKFRDQHLEEIRTRCARLSEEFPPDRPGEYCNEDGRRVVRDYQRA